MRVVFLVGLLVATVSGCALVTERPTEPVIVTEAVDGDTVVVENRRGQRVTVRILGVDTPETKKPGAPVECFGPEAGAFTRDVLLGRRVELRYDTQRRDRFGRTLAAVRVDGRDHARELLAGGYARLLVIPPNRRNSKDYLAVELAARAAGRGLWSACPP